MGRVIGCRVSNFSCSSSCRGKFSKILASESHFERFGTHAAGQRASHRHGSMVSFNTSQLFHRRFERLLGSATRADFYSQRCRYLDEDALLWPHGPWYKSVTSVRSLRDLHSLGPSALGCVNSVETCTSVYNLYLHPSLCRMSEGHNKTNTKT